MSQRRETLRRQRSGCPLCGSTKATVGARGAWNTHKAADGFDDGHRYGNQAARPNCPASTKTSGEVDTLLRTFDSWDNPSPHSTLDGYAPRGGFQRLLTVEDNADSISLAARLLLDGDRDPVAEISVRIVPEDTPRLIAELTAIARKRGLL